MSTSAVEVYSVGNGCGVVNHHCLSGTGAERDADSAVQLRRGRAAAYGLAATDSNPLDTRARGRSAEFERQPPVSCHCTDKKVVWIALSPVP